METEGERRIVVPVADVHTLPDLQSSLDTQRLFNHSVELGAEHGDYQEVAWPTGEGWVYKSHMGPGSAGGSNWHVSVAETPVYNQADPEQSHWTRLPFNAPVEPVWSSRDGWVEIEGPLGKRGWIPEDNLADVSKVQPTRAEVVRLATELFMGTQYRWGGLTPRGCDCSGLVLSVFSYLGHEYRHNTKEQIRGSREIPFEQAQPADLLFFPDPAAPDHVAIYLGDNEIIHANLLNGGITIDSINPRAANYNPTIGRWVREGSVTVKQPEIFYEHS